MATYAYQQNVFEGAAYGYVKYNITPAFGTLVCPGDTILISGVAYFRNDKRDAISLSFCAAGNQFVSYFSSPKVQVDIPKATETAFEIEYVMPGGSQNMPNSRLVNTGIAFTLWNGNSGDMTVTAAAQQITFLKYHLVQGIDPDFKRYEIVNSAYVESSGNGQYVFGTLKISLEEGHSTSEITSATLRIINDGTGALITTRTIPASALASAVTSTGYVEGAPVLLSGLTFDLGVTYRLQFELGDQYSIVYETEYIMACFANMHESGQNAGVCFGGFCTGTKEDPKMESHYPIYAYKGFGNPNFVASQLFDIFWQWIYPIGAIYMSTVDLSPADLMGGTWERIQGKFLLAAGAGYPAGSEGGAASASISIEAHKHTITTYDNVKFASSAVSSGTYDIPITGSTSNAGAATKNISTLPPYLAVYVWKRIA